MDFGGIVEQPLYSHQYRTESIKASAFEQPLTKLVRQHVCNRHITNWHSCVELN